MGEMLLVVRELRFRRAALQGLGQLFVADRDTLLAQSKTIAAPPARRERRPDGRCGEASARPRPSEKSYEVLLLVTP